MPCDCTEGVPNRRAEELHSAHTLREIAWSLEQRASGLRFEAARAVRKAVDVLLEAAHEIQEGTERP